MAENQPTWRYSMELEKGLICLEPKDPDENLDYTADFNYQQGFVAFPEQVAFSTVEEIWKCHFVVEMSSSPPSLDGAVQAVCAPLNVESEDGVYIRDLICGADETTYHLDVPPGEYDVVVRLYPEVDLPDDLDEAEEFAAVEAAAVKTKQEKVTDDEDQGENEDDEEEEADEEDEDEDDDDLFNPQCKVGITFLPRGTIGPKVLLLSYGDIPDQIVLHRNDGSSYTVPSGGAKS